VPKAMTYKANSVIYFQGDVSDRIYILKAGRVSLNSNDIETGEAVRDSIQTGEFFGVKSALGKYPREENAVALSDSHVVVFSVPEFEQLALSNTRIVMKMLNVFSNQLRRLHAKVRGLLAEGEQVNPELGLYRIGEYYMKKKEYDKALYAFQKYLTYYPGGAYHQDANKLAQQAEQYVSKYGIGQGPGLGNAGTGAQQAAGGASGGSGSAAGAGETGGNPAGAGERNAQLGPVAKQYYAAVSSFSQGNYTEAMKQFKTIVDTSEDREYVVKSMFEIGRCLYSLGRYDDCIRHFTALVQRYPKMPDLDEALFYLGQSYEENGDQERAGGFYKKILSRSGVSEPLKRKVNNALRGLEGT